MLRLLCRCKLFEHLFDVVVLTWERYVALENLSSETAELFAKSDALGRIFFSSNLFLHRDEVRARHVSESILNPYLVSDPVLKSVYGVDILFGTERRGDNLVEI